MSSHSVSVSHTHKHTHTYKHIDSFLSGPKISFKASIVEKPEPWDN